MKTILDCLGKKFWPGPLTIILKANFSTITKYITANTEFVSFRIPKSEKALALLSKLDFPVAAPSANKFCHVSPVTAKHVYSDFEEYPVTILDGGMCEFNMESTVIKPDLEAKKIYIYRKGAISFIDLTSFIEEQNKTNNLFSDFSVEYIVKSPTKAHPVKEGNGKSSNSSHNNESNGEDQDRKDKDESENMEAPGLFLKHYSPKIQTYMVSTSLSLSHSNDSEGLAYNSISLYKQVLKAKGLKCVVLDYDGYIKKYIKENKEKLMIEVVAIRDLAEGDSEKSRCKNALSNMYDFLRWTEDYPEADCVLVPLLEEVIPNDQPEKATLSDRALKASSSTIASFI
eukprot:CAMPEP_0170525354 /NCGR_PEP_ID=MMETSP0209-20121228/10864_1 /TAXON_ID=665100 ORGANISM="Litonotus pictus, Strain P1" /NCGR_SAMPLE_ID=MMETSP0209 /ASSEMBLY_ACC=CAM_ASM_000301 /LENGTH=342 /DNA_ID=CAMNT_0010814597 /DNA_START=270 /DNA_END=1298 /DNA_ORIENTATION=+